jgi:cyclohexadienyl dehydratase
MTALRTTLLLVWIMVCGAAHASPRPVLRVGTSGDYAPFSLAIEGEAIVFEGFDLAVARAFAEAHGYELEARRFKWKGLSGSLEKGRFDVAMSGVTVIPSRSAIGRFSIPVVETGAVVLVGAPERFPDLDSLNKSTARIGVNAGGYLEGVAHRRFPMATLLAIPDNGAVLDALSTGNVHAAVTDTAEATLWLDASPGALQLGPITRDRKAYLVHPDRPDIAAQLDRWLLAREADGTLAGVRSIYFGENAGPAVATPLLALLAAIDERLSLMPQVAVAKREAGMALAAPRREARVLDAALEAVEKAAAEVSAPPVDEALVRALFRAQIDAAKQVQSAALKDPDFERPEHPPDIDGKLRPALIRIGEKIARMIVALPPGLEADAVRAATLDQLRAPLVNEHSKRAIADALIALSRGAAAQ